MILVDTSAWLAITDVRDGNHPAALGYHRELLTGRSGRLLTTDYMLDETLTRIRKRSGEMTARRFVEGLDSSESVQLIWITLNHYRTARTTFLDQGARSWSFTDCTSLAVMRELGIGVAFSFDSDFRKAGFEIRPTESG